MSSDNFSQIDGVIVERQVASNSLQGTIPCIAAAYQAVYPEYSVSTASSQAFCIGNGRQENSRQAKLLTRAKWWQTPGLKLLEISMYGLLEIGIAILLLAAIFLHPTAREWVSQIRRSDRCAVIAILAMLMIGQVVNESRTTFPFVRWSMYTEPFEDEPIVVGKFQALHADGTKNWINLARCYPSISRNSHDRLALILQRRAQGKLSQAADEYFGKFMLALGARYQRNHSGTPVIEVRAILQTVLVNGNKSTTNDVVVKALQLGSGKTTRIARSN